MKYTITGVVVGSALLGEYEATTPQEAISISMKEEESYHPILCWHCNDLVMDPDITTVVVYDESGEEVYREDL